MSLESCLKPSIRKGLALPRFRRRLRRFPHLMEVTGRESLPIILERHRQNKAGTTGSPCAQERQAKGNN
eukprot:1146617-Pelagomonas_calceolata.AAC.2